MDAIKGAAAGGHIELLSWLLQNGMSFFFEQVTMFFCSDNSFVADSTKKRVCRYAAENKQFDVLKWAISNEIPCDEGTYNS